MSELLGPFFSMQLLAFGEYKTDFLTRFGKEEFLGRIDSLNNNSAVNIMPLSCGVVC